MSNREESHISMAHGGTVGYAAPEMWSRIYGPVTDRCDVYSHFGNKESRSSKFFYLEWAFKQVEKGEFGNLRKGNMSEEEQVIAKKLSLVGLWCIQFHASRRPKMGKIIQEGEEDITPPPFPFPIDTPQVMELSSFEQSSTRYTLEVEMIDPKKTQTAPPLSWKSKC